MKDQHGHPVPTVKPGQMTRRRLHELVWSTPMRLLAPAFRCSDVHLKTICADTGIPTPPRGWWAKRHAGRKLRPRDLPKGLDPEEIVLEVRKGEVDPPPPPPPPIDADIADALERAKSSREQPETLTACHPLIVATRRGFLDAARQWTEWKRRRDAPRIGGPPGGFDPPPSLVAETPLSVDVCKEQRDRALALLDSVLHAYDQQGFKTGVPDEPELEDDGDDDDGHGDEGGDGGSDERRHRPSSRKGGEDPGKAKPVDRHNFHRFAVTDILGERMFLHVRDRLRLRRDNPGERPAATDEWSTGRSVWEATGRLQLEITVLGVGNRVRRRFIDGATKKLERQIRGILLATIRLAQQARRQREADRIAEIERAKEAEHQRIAEEEHRKVEAARQAEERRVARLLAVSERWERAERLRTFIAACGEAAGAKRERSSECSTSDPGTGDLNDGETAGVTGLAWLDWAATIAARLDPLVAGFAAVQDAVDREPNYGSWLYGIGTESIRASLGPDMTGAVREKNWHRKPFWSK